MELLDLAEEGGVRFVLRNGATPQKRMIQTMTGGVAAFDYNGDGRPDLYFANGARIPQLEKTDGEYLNRLYRNDGDRRFTDVTAEAGVGGAGYAMGVAAGDYDNDGHIDLFVAGVNRNILFRNLGNGKFDDVTVKAGLAWMPRTPPNAGIPSGSEPSAPKEAAARARAPARKPWSVAAGWFDYDKDGSLDLFVVNYLVWSPAGEPVCTDSSGTVFTYCHPRLYEGLPNQLYRNRGDGTFEDVSEKSGVGAQVGKGMAIAFGDGDSDGRLDVFVTNDTVPNFLFRNEGNGRFREIGRQAGVAFNDDGRTTSSMGTDFRDFDNDGLDDILVTALTNETFPLFRNLGKGMFEDVTYATGVGRAALQRSGWGNGMFDFDNDGWKDIFTANGDVQDNTELLSSRSSRQPNSILVNRNGQRFEDASASAGATFQQPGLHRGAAFADFDGDGRIDVAISRLNDRARLFFNETRGDNGWIGFRLTGTRSNRDAIGARIRVVAGRTEQWNRVTTSVGYGSSSDRGVHFGLGSMKQADVVEIEWPSGVRQRLEKVAGGQVVSVTEPEKP